MIAIPIWVTWSRTVLAWKPMSHRGNLRMKFVLKPSSCQRTWSTTELLRSIAKSIAKGQACQTPMLLQQQIRLVEQELGLMILDKTTLLYIIVSSKKKNSCCLVLSWCQAIGLPNTIFQCETMEQFEAHSIFWPYKGYLQCILGV